MEELECSDVLNCSFSSWYDKFKKVTFPSLIIPLEKEFVDYLLTDGTIILPKRTDNASNEVDEDNNWNDVPENEAPSFPNLNNTITQYIQEMGGSVFPKLNWSSPKDATWITLNNSLKCQESEEIYLLLKSSDFITHDLTRSYHCCKNITAHAHNEDFELVLRKWVDVNPGTEFRCFVKENKLIGISQRDMTNFYSHIVHNKTEIVKDILSFFKEVIKDKFPSSSYVFDVCRIRKDKVKLVDFNIFYHTTDSLLFEWEELNVLNEAQTSELPEFRCILTNFGIQPNPYRKYAMPIDFTHLTTGEDPLKFMDFLKMKIQSENNTDSDDEDQIIT